MDFAKIFPEKTLRDFELVLKDDKGEIILHLHKIILVISSHYFDKMLEFKDVDQMTMIVPHANAAKDLILSFYFQPIPSTDWLYMLQMVKTKDYFAMEVEMPSMIIPKEGFEMFLEVCEIVGFSSKTLAIINKNLPRKYPLSRLSPDLIELMIEEGYRHRIISTCRYRRDNIKVWDFDAKLILPYDSYEIITCSTLTHDNKNVICGSLNNIKVFNMARAKIVHTIEHSDGIIQSITTSRDDQYIIYGCDGAIKMCDMKGLQVKIFCGSITPYYRHLVSLGITKMKYTEMAKEFEGVVLAHRSSVECLVTTRTSSRLLSGSKDKSIIVWDLATGLQIYKLVSHLDSIKSLTITSDDKYVISGSNDCIINIWDLEKGTLMRSLNNESEVYCTAITSDDKYIVSGSEDSINVWDIETCTKIRTLIDAHITTRIAILKDKYIITNDSYGKINLWDFPTGTLVKTIDGHQYGINGLFLQKIDTRLTKRLKKFLMEKKIE